MSNGKFAHLHVHTEHSSLDGKGLIPDYVRRAKQLGQPALAITDHGVMSGAYEFYTECLDQGIEPILGEEFYFVPDATQAREDKDLERFHVSMLARGEKGYKVLCELSTEAHRRFYGKPLIDRPLLESLSRKDRKSIYVLSGCAGSIISRKALGGVDGSPEEELNWWTKNFPNFYIELMHHNTDFDRRLNKRLLRLSRRFDLPWVITNDPHYVLEEDACHHDALLAIQTAAELDDPNRFRFDGEGYHLKSRREMRRAFRQYGDSVWKPGARNTLSIAKDCKTRIKAWDSRSWHIPKFPGVDDAQRELERLAWAGLKERGLDKDKRYRKRLKHELSEFAKVGMADFLLIQADINQEARRRKIRIGPGRGSVSGTLVGYLIGIHKTDSVKYNLLFERFLNPDRPKMPDIDMDFPRSRRNEMIQYAVEKYGERFTMRVGAYQRMKIKGAFQSLAKTYGIPFKEANAISKKIEEDEDGDAVLPESVKEAYPDLHATLMSLAGLKKGVSRHPAGVIIFDPNDSIRKLVPEMWIASSKQFVSQFDLDAAAGLGLLKQDFLGLRTLDTIQECVDLIRARHGVDIEPDDWVPGEEEGDKNVWKMLRQGKTAGVFQMEGGANHRGIQEVKCREFEDIVSTTSLYRAGPMIAGAPQRFNQNRKDKIVRVAHPSLKPFLENSWGEMIYQEQMFEILKELAGFSWARVDDAKTAMTKKDAEKMAALQAEAVEGFQKVAGMSHADAEEVWSTIAAQASYLFNRSHAVSYSVLTYQTARLKMLYPLEFLAALLRTVEPKNDQDKGKRENYLTEALNMDYKIMPPDINVSDAGFMPSGDDELLFGLSDIKGVGDKMVKKLIAGRERAKGKKYRSVAEVSISVNNKGAVNALAASGALRSLGVEPEVAKQEELLGWQFVDHMAPFRKKYAKKIKNPGEGRGNRVWLLGEITKVEKRKTKNGGDFLTWTLRHEPGVEWKVNVWESAFDIFGLPVGSVVGIRSSWSQEWNNASVGDSEDVKIIRRGPVVSPRDAKTRKKAS